MTRISYSIPAAAAAADVTERTIRAWIANGWLKAHRQSRNKDGDPTGKHLILEKDLRECLENLPAA